MVRNLLAVSLVLGMTAPAFAQLKVQDIKARHGRQGPERTSLDITPGDELVFTFNVIGLREKGKTDCAIAYKVSNTDGKVVSEHKLDHKGVLPFGGGQIPGWITLAIGLDFPPGKYTVVVFFTDKIHDESVSFERTVTVVQPRFAIVRPRFSYDPEGKTQAGTIHSLGNNLCFRLIVVGFDRSQKKIDLTMSAQIYDDKGKELMSEPLVTNVKSENEQQVAAGNNVTFNGNLSCNRAGKFIAKIMVTDNVTKKSVSFESPLQITE